MINGFKFLKFSRFYMCRYNYTFSEMEYKLKNEDDKEKSNYIRKVMNNKQFMDKIGFNKDAISNFSSLVKYGEDVFTIEEKLNIYNFLLDHKKFNAKLYYYFIENGIEKHLDRKSVV